MKYLGGAYTGTAGHRQDCAGGGGDGQGEQHNQQDAQGQQVKITQKSPDFSSSLQADSVRCS